MEVLQSIFGENWGSSVLIVLNLILIESLLSVDNAAVLATMVMDLPKEQRAKALKYGIIGAYVFRGLCLLLASWLVKIWWLKPLGGIYLIYLMISYLMKEATPSEEDDLLNKKQNIFYKYTLGLMGKFWATVALVELMDLAFSLDNVFAAVAFTDNIYLIWTGVFIGILAMRFVANTFVSLMERYPFLESVAFIVIGILGLKLTLSIVPHFYPETGFSRFLESEASEWYVSLLTILTFVVPVITSIVFNFPGGKKDT